MKNGLLLLVFFVLLSACNNNDDDSSSDTALVGAWSLAEVLADPGDGSGTFVAVDSDKIISFHSDGSMTSNGLLCDMSISADSGSTGTYFESESVFSSPSCISPEYNYSFEHTGNSLVITYFCIEPCKAKYIKK